MNRNRTGRFRPAPPIVSRAVVLLPMLAIAAGAMGRADAKPPGKAGNGNTSVFVSGGSVVIAGDVATFGVYLSKASKTAIDVDFATVDGTAAVAHGDYLPAWGTLTFAPGETFKTVTVQTLPDVYPEFNEEFYLWAAIVERNGSFSSPSMDGCTILGEWGPSEVPWWGDWGDPPISP